LLMRKSVLLLTLTLVGCSFGSGFKTEAIRSYERMDAEGNEATANVRVTSPLQSDSMANLSKTGINGNRNDSILTFIGTKGNLVKEEGAFYDINFQMVPNAEDPIRLEASQIALSIPINSLKTGKQMLTDHLLSEDFFDAETYPQATFLSTNIESKGGTRYDITGNLTMHGVSKPLTITADISDAGLTMKHTLLRSDFNIGVPGGVDNEVELEANIPFLR